MFKRATATGLTLLAPLLVVLARAVYGGRVPNPLPTHWTVGGAVDNTADAQTAFVVAVVISALLGLAAAAAVWFRHSELAGRMTVCALTFGAWMTTAVFGSIMIVSADATSAQQVSLRWYFIVLVILVPLLVAAGSWSLLPVTPTAPQRRPAIPTMQLGDTERATWIGRAQSRPVIWIGVIGILTAAVLVSFHAVAAAVVFATALILLMVSEIGVRVDAGGLHTLWGPFGWPRSVVRLPEIGRADVENIEPMSWGGWGYRISPRGTAAIVRGGPGIVVERTGGRRYAVTVDDAEQGAELLNALVSRAHRAG